MHTFPVPRHKEKHRNVSILKVYFKYFKHFLSLWFVRACVRSLPLSWRPSFTGKVQTQIWQLKFSPLNFPPQSALNFTLNVFSWVRVKNFFWPRLKKMLSTNCRGAGGSEVEERRQGLGVQEWADGSRYEGEFVNGFKDGKGRYSWSSGEVGVRYRLTGAQRPLGAWQEAAFCLCVLSCMRALSTETTDMETDGTSGQRQATSSPASSTSTERKDMDNTCSLMEPPSR